MMSSWVRVATCRYSMASAAGSTWLGSPPTASAAVMVITGRRNLPAGSSA